MSTGNSKIIAKLNKLLATCKDSANGYQSANNDVDSEILKGLFGSCAQERAAFVSELLAEVHRLDDEASRTGSVAGSVHRGWMNVKATVTRRDAHIVLADCERGERKAVSRYEDVLQDELPEQTRAILEKQHAKIKEAHATVHKLAAIGALKTLIATCTDGEKGYASAAQDVNDDELRKLFEMQMAQRASFAEELTREYHRLGGEREKLGTWKGLLHRGWMNLQATLKSKESGVILKECERGEHAALKHYATALQGDMPEETRALVQKQHAKITEAYDRIVALRARVTV